MSENNKIKFEGENGAVAEEVSATVAEDGTESLLTSQEKAVTQPAAVAEQGGTYAVFNGPQQKISQDPSVYPPIYKTQVTDNGGVSPERIRIREIRRLSNASVLPLILFWVISDIFVTVLSFAMVFIMGYDGAMNLFNDPDFNYIINGFLSIMLLSLPFFITAAWTKQPLSRTVKFGGLSFTKTASVLMMGIGVCALSNYANAVFSSIINAVFGEPAADTSIGYGTGPVSFVVSLVCVAIIPAVMEEFAFRGVLLGTAKKFTSDGFAIISTALLFSLLHGNLGQIPFTFILGLFLGYMTVYTGSVIPAMILHALNNGLSVVLSVATVSMSPLTQTVIMSAYYLVSLLIGLCGLLFGIISDRSVFKLSDERSADNSLVCKKYFTSVSFIIFAVYAICRVVATQWLY